LFEFLLAIARGDSATTEKYLTQANLDLLYSSDGQFLQEWKAGRIQTIQGEFFTSLRRENDTLIRTTGGQMNRVAFESEVVSGDRATVNLSWMVVAPESGGTFQGTFPMRVLLIREGSRWKPDEWQLIQRNETVEVDMELVGMGGIPNPLFDRKAANETSTVGTLRAVNTACATYASTYGQFPPTLIALGPPREGVVSANAADQIDEKTASGTNKAYTFLYEARDTNHDGSLDAYTLLAFPKKPGSSGRRYFFTDQTGLIRSNELGPANANSPPFP